MRLSNVHRGALSASALALVTALWSGCAPDTGVVFGGATGTGTTSAGTTNGTGGEGQGSTTGGTGGLGAGGAGGQGGAPPGCDLDSDGMISVDCTGGTDCDDDGDGHDTLACAGGTDCDDTDSTVNPDQSNYFEMPSPNVGFDYNCNGMEDPEFTSVVCEGLFCDFQQDVFLVRTVACGETGPFGNCGTFCGHENVTMNVQRCR